MRRLLGFASVAFVTLVACSQPDGSPESREEHSEALSSHLSPFDVQAAQASPPSWAERQKLTASDGAADDFFGRTVSFSGDTAIVGAYGDDVGANVDQGSAYVFVRSGASWTLQQKLTATDGGAGDAFGITVSLSGNTALIGAYLDDVGANLNQGSAYVFERSGTSWTQQRKLTAGDAAAEDWFGSEVKISGTTAFVAAQEDRSVYVFVGSGPSWSQQQKLTASDGGDNFGTSISLSGNTAVIGAYLDDVGSNLDQGSAYVFVRNGASWIQQQKLTASDGTRSEWFGISVTVSGDTALVGAGSSLYNPGSAYVFARSGTSWTEQQKLMASDGARFNRFGYSVDLSDDRVLVGAYGDDVGGNMDQGAVYLFAKSGATWTEQQKLLPSDGAANDAFGISTSHSIDTAFIGSYTDGVGSNARQGSAYVFFLGAANGTSCSLGSECASNRCVQNVCCSDDCTGACESCLAAHTGGVNGDCAPVTVGTDPKNLCDVEPPATCGTTGACGGAGACAFHPPTTPCGAPVCSGTTSKDQFCSGSGSCVPESGGTDCAPFTCSDGACNDPCGGDAECVAGYFCSSGSCVPKGGTGAPCGDDDECADGRCVDDVCCESICDGVCEACSTLAKGSGDDGACEPVAAGGDPDDDCAGEAPETCGRTGACDGSGACRLHAAGVSCGASTCDMSTARGQLCDGGGRCVSSTTGVDCAPYACAAGACRNPCTGPSDCLTGYVCIAGTCRAPGSTGTPCDDGSECTSGLCADGVCCDDACGGACMACSAATKGQGADGECGPIRAAQDPDDDCAAEGESTCGQNGQCNGAGACARWAQGTECASGTCSGTTQTAPSTCDADGECVAGEQTACVRGYRCDGRACATGCDDDSMCTPGYVCDQARGACIAEPDGTAGAGGESGAAAGGTAGNATGGVGGTGGSGDIGGEGGEATAPKPKADSSDDDAGCDCRIGARSKARGAWLLGAALMAFVARRRRRRSAHPIVR